jgi:protein-L-isoaspartate(D-aspartate) O-methyltransferase
MYDRARLHMIESQIKPSDVTDPRLLAAFAAVEKERFVPSAIVALTYAEAPLEVAPGRFLLEPRTFAKLIKLAEITAEDRVLDVGCATGYSAALLARLAGKVIALEQDADLVRVASGTLVNTSVTVVQGALIEGARQEGPFDAIIVEGAIEEVPQTLLSQLAEGGRLVAVVQQGPQGKAMLYLKENGSIGGRAMFDASAPVLAGFKKMVGFIF